MISIFGQEVGLKEKEEAVSVKNPKGEVEFEKVCFDYGRRRALDGLTMTVPAGKRVAIVGPSGAGKSTITKLLFRLYDPNSGSIKIDNIDLRDYKKEDLYKIIALVPQETILFNDTIEHNIRFGKTDASQEEVLRAIRLAHLDDLIRRLPEGLDTIVGERGVKLSGGEKQRVAIARAIIKEPRILVFDEATSNLDAESEKEILRAIREVSEGRTTVSIAHRLPTIIDSDIIFVIDQGKLVEKGTHRELLAERGLYAKLWQTFKEDRTKE
jgi:ATP-binding cassette subfamily B protein